MRMEPVPTRDVPRVTTGKKGRDAMAEGHDAPPDDDDAEGIPLLEGWMLGRLLFPLAMDEIQRVPPANDDEA